MTLSHVTADSSQPDRDRLSLVGLGLVLLLTVTMATALAAWPKAGTPVGVVFAPWVPRHVVMDRVAAAGGTVVDFGGVPNVVVAMGPPTQFYGQLLAQGALAILDGRLTSSLCVASKVEG